MEPLFLMNSSSLSSLWHMKLQESTGADRSMLGITVTSKGIKKLLLELYKLQKIVFSVVAVNTRPLLYGSLAETL